MTQMHSNEMTQIQINKKIHILIIVKHLLYYYLNIIPFKAQTC